MYGCGGIPPMTVHPIIYIYILRQDFPENNSKRLYPSASDGNFVRFRVFSIVSLCIVRNTHRFSVFSRDFSLFSSKFRSFRCDTNKNFSVSAVDGRVFP